MVSGPRSWGAFPSWETWCASVLGLQHPQPCHIPLTSSTTMHAAPRNVGRCICAVAALAEHSPGAQLSLSSWIQSLQAPSSSPRGVAGGQDHPLSPTKPSLVAAEEEQQDPDSVP